MGAFHFVMQVNNYNKTLSEEDSSKKIKAIVGCEFFVCEDHLNKNHKDNGYQIVLLAKNKKGYHNLAKMSSIAFTDGFYYVPRIDKKLLKNTKKILCALWKSLWGSA